MAPTWLRIQLRSLLIAGAVVITIVVAVFLRGDGCGTPEPGPWSLGHDGVETVDPTARSSPRARFPSAAERVASPFHLPEGETCKPPPPGAIFYSQSQEDEALHDHFFCGVRGGTYVELGAMGGVAYSNTNFFEKSMDWSGVLIEGHPSHAKSLFANRPNAKIFSPKAVCADGVGSIEFMGSPNGVSGAVETMSNKFRKTWHNGKTATFQVDCKPIGTMLRGAGINSIDLFSLDVEGAELVVLETMDWSIPVRVWVIELDGLDTEKDTKVRSLLTGKGYARSAFDIRRWCPVGGDCTANEVWVCKGRC